MKRAKMGTQICNWHYSSFFLDTQITGMNFPKTSLGWILPALPPVDLIAGPTQKGHSRKYLYLAGPGELLLLLNLPHSKHLLVIEFDKTMLHHKHYDMNLKEHTILSLKKGNKDC